jgi:hypothetical protein
LGARTPSPNALSSYPFICDMPKFQLLNSRESAVKFEFIVAKTVVFVVEMSDSLEGGRDGELGTPDEAVLTPVVVKISLT